MIWKSGLLGAGLLLAACSGQSEQDALTANIAQSIRVGEAAADARPGYGFDLYPGAQVTSSMMDGMSVSIRTGASFEEIVAFYEDQLTERNWQIQSREMNNGKIALKGFMPTNPHELMSITVAPAERPGDYHLVFLKMILGD